MPNSVQKSMSQYINNDGRGITPFASTLGTAQAINLFTEDSALTYTVPTGSFHTSAKPPAPCNDSRQAPEVSKEHSRLATLWALPDCTIIRTQEAALMLTRSVRTLQNWRYKRTGPAYQLGRTVTYRISDLKAYVESCTTSALRLSK